jgi:hypothetical protein
VDKAIPILIVVARSWRASTTGGFSSQLTHFFPTLFDFRNVFFFLRHSSPTTWHGAPEPRPRMRQVNTAYLYVALEAVDGMTV